MKGMKAGDAAIVVEQYFEQSPEAVWQAITDIDEMKKWYFEVIPEFIPKIGAETTFSVSVGDRIFIHHWKISAVVPGEKITYTWHFDHYAGKSDTEFLIMPSGTGCILRLTATVYEDFPDDINEFTTESCQGGWEYFIQKALPEYFNSN